MDIRQDQADRFDNRIDVFGKTFLGLTVACARCHDHKFDAISAKDYYALFGFLESSNYRLVRFDSLEHNRRSSPIWPSCATSRANRQQRRSSSSTRGGHWRPTCWRREGVLAGPEFATDAMTATRVSWCGRGVQRDLPE